MAFVLNERSCADKPIVAVVREVHHSHFTNSPDPMPWKHWSAERLGVVLAVLAALGFSFKAIFVKLAYAAAPVDAVTLLSLRMVFSLPAFLWVGFAASRSAPPLTRNDWGMLGALGLLGYYGASILDFLGLQYISAALERLILFTYPTLTVLIGVLFMGKSLARREVAALLLSYAGIALAFAHDLHVAGEMVTVLTGVALVFGSCEAMIKCVEALGERQKWNDFVAGTMAGLASNVPEIIMLGFVVAAAPRVAFVVTCLTLHVNALIFGVYSALLPKNETGHALLPSAITKLGADLLACAAGVFLALGTMMLTLKVFDAGDHRGEGLILPPLVPVDSHRLRRGVERGLGEKLAGLVVGLRRGRPGVEAKHLRVGVVDRPLLLSRLP